jgi:hypothetical protein
VLSVSILLLVCELLRDCVDELLYLEMAERLAECARILNPNATSFVTTTRNGPVVLGVVAPILRRAP